MLYEYCATSALSCGAGAFEHYCYVMLTIGMHKWKRTKGTSMSWADGNAYRQLITAGVQDMGVPVASR